MPSKVVYCTTSPVYCMHLTLGNFKILKIMNLASTCRYPLWFPLLSTMGMTELIFVVPGMKVNG